MITSLGDVPLRPVPKVFWNSLKKLGTDINFLNQIGHLAGFIIIIIYFPKANNQVGNQTQNRMAGEAKEDLTQHRDAKGNPQVCLYNQRSPISNGVFFGDNPFKFVFPVTLFQVFLVTFFAQVIYFVLRPIKTPRIICLALVHINLYQFRN